MWAFCRNLLLGSYHESMCFWLSIPRLKRSSMLKCQEGEAKSWPRSSSADGLRGGWQPTLCTCITFKKEKLTPSHLLFLFRANFSLAHCIQELRGSHVGYSSGWPNLQILIRKRLRQPAGAPLGAMRCDSEGKVAQSRPTLCDPTDRLWDSPGQITGVGSLSFLQRIFPTQGSNPGLPNCRRILYQLSHKGSPRILEWVAYPFSSGSSDPGIKPGSPALKADSFFFIIHFNWRLITLQYCSGFLPYIDMNQSWVYMCSPSWSPLPPPSPSHPSGSSQCTSPEYPVSCIEPGLAIRFTCDNIHVCFNAILRNHSTLALSHRVQKTVLYICVSFAVSHIELLFLSKFHIYALIHCIDVFLSGLLHSVK